MTAASLRRRGFTLIELLVVIAIIAILIGLLVPAVQKVRAAAARAQCSNNLKQIGLAMHMHQDNYKKLPMGWVTSLDGTIAPSPGWSWAVLILPYLEQGPLYNQISTLFGNPRIANAAAAANPPNNNPVSAGTNGAIIQTSIPIYICPSDAGGPLNTNFNSCAKN